MTCGMVCGLVCGMVCGMVCGRVYFGNEVSIRCATICVIWCAVNC